MHTLFEHVCLECLHYVCFLRGQQLSACREDGRCDALVEVMWHSAMILLAHIARSLTCLPNYGGTEYRKEFIVYLVSDETTLNRNNCFQVPKVDLCNAPCCSAVMTPSEQAGD